MNEPITVPTRALVLSAIDNEHRLDAGPLFSIADQLDMTARQLRLCLSRMVDDGTLNQLNGRGRTAIYEATEAGQKLLDIELAYAAFGYRIDAELEPWDHNWHLISFEIPERRRGARDALRNVFREIQLAPVHGGLYIHPFDSSGIVFALADALGVREHLARFSTESITIATYSDDQEVAKQVWPITALAERYRTLEKQFNTIADGATTIDGNELAALMLKASLQIEDTLRLDPLLPNELLPDPWPGTAARQAYRNAYHIAKANSSLLANSNLMTSHDNEITQALTEPTTTFWARWGPKLLDAHLSSLPPAALRNTEPDG